jgi:pimeloyl-ACP methyl ester carboxylesterase
VSAQTLETADGRTLAYEDVGDPDGVPLFMLHGTPGSRLSGRHPDLSRVKAAGLRIISYDRPGYGRSSRHHGRRVVDCVADVAAIADLLGLGRFAVTGGSGGGPHALAVGARLPDRVSQVACDVSGAPYDAPGLDWLEGMDEVNIREFGWAFAGEETLARELEREVSEILHRLEDDPTAALAGIELSASDRAVLDDPGVRESLAKSTREMFVQGALGWIDDDLAFITPWGFDVEELRVPVEVRYGATDVLVPPSHGEWLAAHIPNATVIVDQVGGHLSTPDERLQRLSALVV